MSRMTQTTKRRRGLGLAVVLLCSMLAFVASPTSANAALNQGVLELEGNAVDDPATGIDWANVHAGQTATTRSCPGGATACAWVNDGAPNATIFTGGGSKDPENIPAWRWKDQSGGLPDKDNLLHSFAARFNANGKELLYFGSDRYDNSGDAHQAFWFFQNEVSLKADGTFNGTHRNGDLLVISEFSNGGSVSTIVVYKWNSSVAGNLQKLAEGTNAKCSPAVATQTFCGIVNPTDGTASPWPFLDKRGNTTFAQGELFEGGINLSDPAIDLAGQCFASFASETRSSTSTTAVLKDFVLGGFGNCGSSTVTTPMQSDGTTAIPATGISIGAGPTGGAVPVRDAAVVTATGGSVTPTGSVAFWLCGPTATGATALCETGGTALGTTQIPATTANPATVVSPVATVTAAGRYCFRAVYSGDATKGIPPSSDFAANECFLVNPVTPGLTTQAGTSPVNLGQAVTDTASLTGTAKKPGSPVINPTTAGGNATGTITFQLYGPGIANCNTAVGAPSTVTVNGDGTYNATPVTPATAGTYYWKATYNGDLPNTTATAQHNVNCDVSAEEVVVQQLTPTISTAQSFVPNDSATITVSGGGNLAGSVVFELFGNHTCSGTALYTSSAIDVTTGAGTTGLSKTVSSSNTTAYSATQDFSWRVTYTSTNGGHTNATHRCGIERSSININNAAAATE